MTNTTKTITAAEILARFEAGKTDFRDLGECTVRGALVLSNYSVVEIDVNLGALKFDEPVLLGSVKFDSFECDSATFNSFDCGSATFTSFECDSATFESFDCGSAKFNSFECHLATFRRFHCGSAKFNSFDCDSATFDSILADENPALAWVIQQYKVAGVYFKIEHAPPWMLKIAGSRE